ncbi:AAA family ATPase [Xinfangfangia sp. D13-10-4-6]|uniref:ATP-binding cassette domain-containing protein n=1 Tax=Pseudogemmobacter hezensis TaxID=2737662 RepID=UPI001557DB0F|nr:ABC transporter ATP-binding protein [Pseudogemmobacter hezensis]NPD14384.1 AAA family ATPase [Pseudogemmobacter hezensis]
MADPILVVEGLCVRAKGRIIFDGLDFALPATGMTALMGPVGTGKSSLIKWLCARAEPAIYKIEYRRADYFFAPLTRRNRPLLYAQRQAKTVEQMFTLLSLHLKSNPALICIDEITADLAPADSERVMERLSIMARSRALLVVSHNQQEVRDYADHVMLVAGGRMQEFTPARQFFETPQTDAGRQFVGSGWVVTREPGTPDHHLSAEMRELPFDLTIEPVGGNDRLLSLCGGKLFLLDLEADGALPPGVVPGAAEISALICLPGVPATGVPATGALTSTGLTSTSLPAVRLPDAGPTGDFAADRARIALLRARMAAGGSPAILRCGNHHEVARLVALLLISMQVSADKASDMAARLLGLPALDVETEQELWDFELAQDLAQDQMPAPPDPPASHGALAAARQSAAKSSAIPALPPGAVTPVVPIPRRNLFIRKV